MKNKIPITLALAAVGSTCWLGGAVATRTRWLNEETAAQSKWQWEEHCRKYGAFSNNVIYGFSFDTNLTVGVGAGTNRYQIEFGFRDDGTVVWRKQ